jgi:hypothetical protein
MIFIKTASIGMFLDFVNSSLGYGLGSRVFRPWNLIGQLAYFQNWIKTSIEGVAPLYQGSTLFYTWI